MQHAVNELSLGNTGRTSAGRSRDCYACKEVHREQMSGPHGGTHTLLGGWQAAHRSGGSLTRYLGNLYRTLEAVRGRLQVDAELRRRFTPDWIARSELSSPKVTPRGNDRREPARRASFQSTEISPFFCHVVSDSAGSQVEEAGCFFWFLLGESSRANIIRARRLACVVPSRESHRPGNRPLAGRGSPAFCCGPDTALTARWSCWKPEIPTAKGHRDVPDS